MAKSILKSHRIKFFSNGENFGSLVIKVYPKDEKAAKELLSGLEPSGYEPKTGFEKFLANNMLYLIAGFLIIVFIIILMAKK